MKSIHHSFKTFRFITLIIITIVAIFISIQCDYDKATYNYANIIPDSVTSLAVTSTNATGATLTWVLPLNGTPTPALYLFTIHTNAGNTVTNQSSNIYTNVTTGDLTSLSGSTIYNTFIRSSNVAGHSDSDWVRFETP